MCVININMSSSSCRTSRLFITVCIFFVSTRVNKTKNGLFCCVPYQNCIWNLRHSVCVYKYIFMRDCRMHKTQTINSYTWEWWCVLLLSLMTYIFFRNIFRLLTHFFDDYDQNYNKMHFFLIRILLFKTHCKINMNIWGTHCNS